MPNPHYLDGEPVEGDGCEVARRASGGVELPVHQWLTVANSGR